MKIFGHISGAHVNPAVSISALIMKQISLPDFFIYVISQVGGALTGYASLMVSIPLILIFKHYFTNLCLGDNSKKPNQFQ